MTSSNSALGGLIQRFARGVNITSDTFFSGSVVVDSAPTEDETLLFSMSPATTSSEFTDISSYTRTVTGTYTVGTDTTAVNGEYAIMNTTASFIETDLAISGEADFSVGFWLYASVANVSRILSIGRAGTNLTGEGFFDIYLNNSRLVFTMSSFTTPPATATGGTMIVSITIGEWNHVVFTYSKNTRMMTVYINGHFKSTVSRIDTTWGITEGKGFLRAGAETETPTTAGWWIGRINLTWENIWGNDDIEGLFANDWKPKLSLKDMLFSKVARLTEVASSKVSLFNPIFSGTVSLPETDAVLYDNTTLTSLLDAVGSTPTMSFGTPTLFGTDTIVLPFRDVENTLDLDIGTKYNPIVTAEDTSGTSPLITQIVSRNTNEVRFKLLNNSLTYIPIYQNRSLLKVSTTIIDGALVKASADIPVTDIVGNNGALDSLDASLYTDAVGAYGTRRIFEIYTGPQVSIRRSSDNAQADIYFDKLGAPTKLVVVSTRNPKVVTNTTIEIDENWGSDMQDGWLAQVNDFQYSNDAFNVFDHNKSTWWQTSGGFTSAGDGTAWVFLKYPVARKMATHGHVARIGLAIRDWTLQGSNDGGTWTNVQSFSFTGWTADVMYYFPVTAEHIPYLYWRVYITKAMPNPSAGRIGIQELDFSTYAEGTQEELLLPNIETWLNGATAHVTTWYDQSSNVKHLTQNADTLQPVLKYAIGMCGYVVHLTTGFLTAPNLFATNTTGDMHFMFKHKEISPTGVNLLFQLNGDGFFIQDGRNGIFANNTSNRTWRWDAGDDFTTRNRVTLPNNLTSTGTITRVSGYKSSSTSINELTVNGTSGRSTGFSFSDVSNGVILGVPNYPTVPALDDYMQYILVHSIKQSDTLVIDAFSKMDINDCPKVIATGGTITEVNGYRIHTFTSSGTFTVDVGGEVEYIVVAGGGGGGSGISGSSLGGGGGGAGGMLVGSTNVSPQAFSIVVGAGGAGNVASGTYTSASATGDPDATGDNGNDTIALDLTAIGGGGGGTRSKHEYGKAGGSGGGACGEIDGQGGGAGEAGQGNRGGHNILSSWGACGGGGAGSQGGDINNSSARTNTAGGAGLASSISGVEVFYAGGGGGGGHNLDGIRSGATGGQGGGGRGANHPDENTGQHGTQNTGGGGGGGSAHNGLNSGTSTGGNGGSGIVIIRYLL